MGAIPPLLYSSYGWVRAHSIDPISIIALSLTVVGMLLALLVHDPHILMLKDSFLTGAFGLLCLLSLLSKKPVVSYIRFVLVGDRERERAYALVCKHKDKQGAHYVCLTKPPFSPPFLP